MNLKFQYMRFIVLKTLINEKRSDKKNFFKEFKILEFKKSISFKPKSSILRVQNELRYKML